MQSENSLGSIWIPVREGGFVKIEFKRLKKSPTMLPQKWLLKTNDKSDLVLIHLNTITWTFFCAPFYFNALLAERVSKTFKKSYAPHLLRERFCERLSRVRYPSGHRTWEDLPSLWSLTWSRLRLDERFRGWVLYILWLWVCLEKLIFVSNK